MSSFTRFSYETEVSTEVSEHEVFLSFNSDDDAVEFRYWLEEEGMEFFQKYLDKNKKV